jgi:RAT1-interacting protein
VVSNEAQYCSVVRTGIGKTILCLGGEVDARTSPFSLSVDLLASLPPCLIEPWDTSVWDSKPPIKGAPINWIELKTSAEIQSDRDMDNFNRKLLKFWIQSFLLGVPKIIVGFRSRDGRLLRVEEIETATIPDRVARSGGRVSWDGNTCINFTSAFLDCEFWSGPLPLEW